MKDKIAVLILRISIGVVFAFFGFRKFQNDIWAQTIKSMDFFQNLPWGEDLSVIIIGLTEVITGVALILGIFTRFFSAIASLQLIGILTLLRFQQIRDVGLLGATIYLSLTKNDTFRLDRFFKAKE